MTETMSTTTGNYSSPSLQKQRLLSQYANGNLSLGALSEKMALIQPPLEHSWKRFSLVVIATFILALIPPWAKRED